LGGKKGMTEVHKTYSIFLDSIDEYSGGLKEKVNTFQKRVDTIVLVKP